MKNKSLFGTICVMIASTIWGFTGFFVRQLASAGLSSLDTVFIRAIFGTASCGLFLLFFNPKLFRIRLKDVWCFLGTGILNMVVCAWLYYTGVQYGDLSVMSVLIYTGPAYVMMFGVMLFHEKFTAKKVLALILTFIGCCFVSGIGSGSYLGWQALLLGLGAGVGYSMYSVFARYASNRGYEAWTITFYSFFFCMLGTAPIINWQSVGAAFSGGASVVFWLVLFGVIEGFISYLFYSKGLQLVEAGQAAILASMEPLTATILGTVLYHEPLTLCIVLGICFVLAGLVVMSVKGKQANVT